ncbi:hypothetical protein C7974DRAFT_447103 [Boeremia exigua]|uniref:uncharacterized protein n=1 Tax=Boeremia exigua TaxID=749465 RepID=UPI001E8E1596|nr:uncharacterized protein C7974DRAFT_447103 [Boeremia exigua]KAH6642517.1 hypothetical protein C7974DRAFT_447103 [Boeremia exigua]
MRFINNDSVLSIRSSDETAATGQACLTRVTVETRAKTCSSNGRLGSAIRAVSESNTYLVTPYIYDSCHDRCLKIFTADTEEEYTCCRKLPPREGAEKPEGYADKLEMTETPRLGQKQGYPSLLEYEVPLEVLQRPSRALPETHDGDASMRDPEASRWFQHNLDAHTGTHMEPVVGNHNRLMPGTKRPIDARYQQAESSSRADSTSRERRCTVRGCPTRRVQASEDDRTGLP